MRTDAQSRIMSLSFKREPEEHTRVMLEAGRRLTTPPSFANRWPRLLIGAIAFGAVVGIAMEGYRRFILSPLLGIVDVPPLNVIVLQLLPFFLLLIALLYLRMHYVQKRRLRAMIERLEPNLFIDIDIYRDGLRLSSEHLTITLEWAAARNVLLNSTRIEFEGESFTTYIPQRAFADRQAFEAAATEIRQLWRDAKGRQTGQIAR
jgi:hypothetical protein